jgi:hypothetical protein
MASSNAWQEEGKETREKILAKEKRMIFSIDTF